MNDFDLENMDYHCDNNGNQSYITYLDNGDELRITKCWRDGYPWEWEVALPGELYGYASNYRSHCLESPEEALDDFYKCYEGRNWLSRAEQDRNRDPMFCRCLACGWEGEERDILSVTIYEDYGDVSCRKCPECGIIEYDGDELFEKLED